MIYLAAPFFNEAQLALVKQAEVALRANFGNVVYSPRLDGTLRDMSSAERVKRAPEIFLRNCCEIDRRKYVVALLDHKDTGTIWECGYAYAKDKSIIGIRSPNAKWQNVMLEFSLTALVPSMPLALTTLKQLMIFGRAPIVAPPKHEAIT